MSQTRLFQRVIRPASFLHDTTNTSNYNSLLNRCKSVIRHKFNPLYKTTALISCGVLFGWSVENYSSSSMFGSTHCLAEYLAGKVYTWGFNRYGQLGVGSENDEGLPIELEALDNIVYISCGAEQSAALTADGKVYTFGRAQDARLGHGETSGSNETVPRLVEELSDMFVTQIDAGYNHMACVTRDGQVWTWGKNTYSQLGHSKASYPNVVQSLLDDGVKAQKVVCGRYHTVVLAEDGRVFAWGGFKSGETGTGQKRTTSSPTPVSALSNTQIVDIAAGQDFTLFLAKDGRMYACGAGDQGQTGLGSTLERCHVTPMLIPQLQNVRRMAAGQFHSICCTADGEVYTFGLNREGQLGHGDTQNRMIPTGIQRFNDDANVKVMDVAAGGGHSACILENDKDKKSELYIFGRGRQGQLGRANNVGSVAANRTTPVPVDYFDTVKCSIEQVVLGTNHSAVLCV